MLALRKQADGFPASLLPLRTEAEVRAVLEAYNAAVRRELLRVATGPGYPVVAHVVDIDAMVARWRALTDGPPGPAPGQAESGPHHRR